jgi:YidC/Oxa1 family membrane protein insertase
MSDVGQNTLGRGWPKTRAFKSHFALLLNSFFVERRLLTWCITSALFLAIYMTLNVMFVPQPPANPVAKQPAAQDGAADGVAGQQLADPDRVAGADADQPIAGGVAAADVGPDDANKASPSLITLGSMDPASGYFILATLNTRGGAVERLELTERTERGNLKFRRVDTNSGYLGYLAAQASPNSDGCIVRVVGPGTPAALAQSRTAEVPAGLMVDDLIVAVGGKAIASAVDLEAVLADTRPGQTLSLEVVRSSVGDKPLVFSAALSEHPLDLVRLSSTGGADEVLGNFDRLSCRVTLSQLGTASIPTGKSSISGLAWIADAVYTHDVKTTEGVQNNAVFTLPLPAARLGATATGPLEIARSYQLNPASYLIDMDIAVRNVGDQPQKIAYRLEGPNGITLEGWWYSTKISPNFMGGAAARDVVYRTLRDGHRLLSGYDLLKRGKNKPIDPDQMIFGEDEPEPNRALAYAGIDAQYFNVAYLPPQGASEFTDFRRAAATLVADAPSIPVHQERAVNVSFFLDSIAKEVPPQDVITQQWQLFAGPKAPEMLDSLGLSDTIEYGWFGGVSKFLGWILHAFNWMIGNYAIAIILLTVLVRACLFPISRNAAIHAQRMQELAPELKKITEKYKDDMEARLKAQREFQKRVGFNPLAGCLPALLQLPIFIGLYRCLSVDLELRQEAFSSRLQWANNLAGPDMLYYWGDWMWEYLSGRGTGWLGPYFNILPVFVVILFLVQQKMFMPPATDEQQAMTQRVMTIMTLMMAIFFFRVPAGLCIYFITSSLWGIAERIVVKRTLPPAKSIAAFSDGGVIDGTVTSKTTEKKSFADRVREQIKPEPPKALPPNKRKRPSGKR